MFPSALAISLQHIMIINGYSIKDQSYDEGMLPKGFINEGKLFYIAVNNRVIKVYAHIIYLPKKELIPTNIFTLRSNRYKY